MPRRACTIILSLLLIALAACSSPTTVALVPATATPPLPSPSAPPASTQPSHPALSSGDSVVVVSIQDVSPQALNVTVSYNYIGDHGNQVYLSALPSNASGDVVGGVGFNPVPIKTGQGTATISMVVAQNVQWRALITYQIRVCIYVGAENFGCQISNYTKQWSGAAVSPSTPNGTATRVPTRGPAGSPTPVPRPTATITPTPPPPKTICQDEACLADGLKLSYLIVTRPLFVQALTPFINWKTGQGYRVGVLTVDWLVQKFPGRHMAESMKTGMHTIRRKTGLQYVLLVGDTAIPVDKFDIDTVMSSYSLTQPWNVPTGFHRRGHADPPREVLPNDTYFVEDRDWDPDNTGLNPIPDQSNSRGRVDATLFLGRWSVRTPAEIAPIFAKTQAVQPTNKIFFTGDASLSHPDAEHIKHCPSLPFTADPYWCYGSPEVTRIYLFGQNAPWLTTERLVVKIDDAAQTQELAQRVTAFDGVIDESYHGSWNYLQMPNANTILFNHNYVMLVSVSCMISGFYNDKYETPMEAMLKAQKGPAVAVEPPNEFAFMFGLREGQTVGQAFWRSTADFFDIGAPSVLLGDPSLQIFVAPNH